MAVAFDRMEADGGRTLVGMRTTMSIAEDATAPLFRRFMPRRSDLHDRRGDGTHCVRIHPGTGPDAFAPTTRFEKWAAARVADDAAVPDGMERLAIPNGRYAVFVHSGPIQGFGASLAWIFGTWLRDAGEVLDDRPHFEWLPEGWRVDDPDAREEVWVPVR
jgi:AraC family transcriptional regulator